MQLRVPTLAIGVVQFNPRDFLSTVGSGRTISSYRPHEAIFTQGEIADSVFCILTGEVSISVLSEHGREAVIAILGRDEFFGEGCLARQKQRIATASAMTDCEIMRIEKNAIICTLNNEPAFSDMFVAQLLKRMIRVEEDLVDQLFNSSEKRLASALLLLANFTKEGRPEPIMAKISHETLAKMVGTSRSRVGFFMNKFRKLGFIDYNGKIEVHSSLLSVVLDDHAPVRRKSDDMRDETDSVAV